MRQSSGLIRGCPIDDAAGVLQYVCVMQGASDGSVKKPSGADVAMVGVTIEAQPNQNKNVAVQFAGIVPVKCGGTVTRGDRLAINGVTGDVKSIEAIITAAPGTASARNVIGQALASGVANDVIPMEIQKFVVNVAVS